MKIGCILVQNSAFQTNLKTMSNFKNHKNMEKMSVEKKIKRVSDMLSSILLLPP